MCVARWTMSLDSIFEELLGPVWTDTICVLGHREPGDTEVDREAVTSAFLGSLDPTEPPTPCLPGALLMIINGKQAPI